MVCHIIFLDICFNFEACVTFSIQDSVCSYYLKEILFAQYRSSVSDFVIDAVFFLLLISF